MRPFVRSYGVSSTFTRSPVINADVVLAHLSGDVRGNDVTVVELNAEHRVRQRVHDGPFHFDLFFLRHTLRSVQKASRILPQAIPKGKTTRLESGEANPAVPDQ